MEIFPRRGIELSEGCGVLHGKARHIRPTITRRFENGSKESRFRTEKGYYQFEVTVTAPSGMPDDFGTILDFIERHGTVTPFTIEHPDYGTGTATLLQAEHDIERVISGVAGHPSLFRIVIPVEAVI